MNYCVICGQPCRHDLCEDCDLELANLPDRQRQKIIRDAMNIGYSKPKPKRRDEDDTDEEI